MKIKTLIASTLLLVAASTLAADSKTSSAQRAAEREERAEQIAEQEKQAMLDAMRFRSSAIIRTDPANPRDPVTGLPENPEPTQGRCHVMPDGYCIFW